MSAVRRLTAKLGVLKALRGEIGWVIFGRVASLAGALISLKILTQQLTLEEYGRFGLALTAANAGALILFSPLGAGVLRFTRPYVEGGRIAALSRLFNRLCPAIGFASAGAGCLIYLLGQGFFEPFAGLALWAMAPVVCALLGLQICSFNAINGMRERRTAALYQATTGLSRAAFAVPLVLLAPTAEAAFLGVGMFLLLQNGLQYASVRRLVLTPAASAAEAARGTETPEDRSLRGFLLYCLPFVLIFTLEAVIMHSDKFLAAHFLSIEDASILIAFQQISRAFAMIIGGVAMQLLYPIIFSPENSRHETVLSYVLYGYMIILVFIVLSTAGVYFGKELFITAFTTSDYLVSAAVLPVLVFGHSLAQAALVLQAQGLSEFKSTAYMAPKFAQAVVSLGLTILLIPVLGLMGAAIATAMAAITLTLGCILVNRRASRRRRKTLS